VPDPVLLFQYSAVTYNTHRIHYDRPYATEVEGYPGLVVHGPLIATLLMELVHKHTSDFAVADFTVRAVLPLFDNAPLELRGRADDKNFRLAALTSSSNLAMSIEGQFVDAVRRPTG
jgi:3-methylfumaryl-CoA hydratase